MMTTKRVLSTHNLLDELQSEARQCRGKADRPSHEVRPSGAQPQAACVSGTIPPFSDPELPFVMNTSEARKC